MNNPTIIPVIIVATVDVINALNPSEATVGILFFATALYPPIIIAILAIPVKPESATVIIDLAFIDSIANCGIPYATTSFVTNLVASSSATFITSSFGTPIKKENGAKI